MNQMLKLGWLQKSILHKLNHASDKTLSRLQLNNLHESDIRAIVSAVKKLMGHGFVEYARVSTNPMYRLTAEGRAEASCINAKDFK